MQEEFSDTTLMAYADGELDAHLETERAQDLGLAQVCFEVQGRELEAEAAADIGTKLVDQSSRRQRRPGRRRRGRRCRSREW